MAKKEGKQSEKTRTASKKPLKKAVKKAPTKKVTKKAQTKKVAKKVVKKTTRKAASKITKGDSKKASKKTTSTKKRASVKSHAVTQSLPKKRESKAERDSRQIALEHLFKKSADTEIDVESKDARLPSHMSLRAVEKAKAIRIVLSDPVAVRVGKFAYIISFAFIAVGGLYSVGHVVTDSAKNELLPANSLTGYVQKDKKLISPEIADIAIPSVEFSLRSSIPEILSEETR